MDKEINQLATSIIKSCPFRRLFFVASDPLWIEETSIDPTKTFEFQKINGTIPQSGHQMCATECVQDDDDEEYDVYCIYSRGEHEGEDILHFLTVVLDKIYTFDYANDKWVEWSK